MVFLSSRISPFTSTVIFLERSPLATAVVTSAMLRTWPVRLPAIALTLSVRSFQVPPTPSHLRLAAELAFGADLAGDAGHFGGEGVELVDHRVDGVLELEDFALHVDGDLLGQVAAWRRRWSPRRCCGPGRSGSPAIRLTLSVRSFQVPATPSHLRLAAQLAFGADLARHARHFRGEAVELIDHGVDRVLELEDLALHVDGDLLGQVAGPRRWSPRRCCGPGRSGWLVTSASSVSAPSEVDRTIGEILPRTGDALHLGLAAELALRCRLRAPRGSLPRRTRRAGPPWC